GALAAGHHLGALLDRVGDVRLDLLDRLHVDQRPDDGTRPSGLIRRLFWIFNNGPCCSSPVSRLQSRKFSCKRPAGNASKLLSPISDAAPKPLYSPPRTMR